MKKIFGLLLMLVVMFTPVSAFATDSYSDNVTDKLSSGFTNTLLSWTKIFSVPHQYQSQNKNPWAGAGTGLIQAIQCTATGAFDLLTFPLNGKLSDENCVDLSGEAAQGSDWEGSTQAPQVVAPAATPAADAAVSK